jgi:RNA polymerase sigma-70 factor (ECF subfamily)
MREKDFEGMVRMHQERVHSYATYMLRDPAEAQDVAQEALIRMWQHHAEIQSPSAKSWLMRTAHNLCIDRIRRRNVRSETDDGETTLSFTGDTAPGPQELAEASDLGRLIQLSLDALTPRDRAVVVMREVQGLPYEEIADILGLPLGTVKARLHRARERLRNRLARLGVRPEAPKHKKDLLA